jgi:hypothetical protein
MREIQIKYVCFRHFQRYKVICANKDEVSWFYAKSSDATHLSHELDELPLGFKLFLDGAKISDLLFGSSLQMEKNWFFLLKHIFKL